MKPTKLQNFKETKLLFWFPLSCSGILRKLRIWLHLLKNSLMEDFFFYAVFVQIYSQNQIFS